MLQGGAKIFVCPEQYWIVLLELDKKSISFCASHVLAAESLIPQLEASIERIPSFKNLRVKKDGVFFVASALKGYQDHSEHGVEEDVHYEDVPNKGIVQGITS